jgi:hypothetical protein
MVIEEAEELRIPLDKRPRILTPSLVRANKEIYLYFAYELVDTINARIYEPESPDEPETVRWVPTEKEESVRVPSYHGGTVIIDEEFREAGILVTDPPASRADTQEAAPALQSARRSKDRDSIIDSGIGYILRHTLGTIKTSGFAGFDWPDEQEEKRAMTTNEEPRGPEGLEQDPIVETLVPDPSKSAVPAIALEGLLGRGDKDGYWRLYFTTEFNEYAEFRARDVLYHESMAPEHPPFVGLKSTRLWVKPNAEIMHTRIESQQVQASFLRGDIETGFMAGAGTTAGPLGMETLGAEAAEVQAIISSTLACHIPIRSRLACPTGLVGCGSWFKRCRR